MAVPARTTRQVANYQVPQEATDIRRVQGSQEHVRVRLATAEEIPQDVRHASRFDGLFLLLGRHVQNSAARKTGLLHQAGDAEDELTHSIVPVDLAAKGRVMPLEVFSTNSVEYGCFCGRFGRSVRGADAIFEQPRRAAVTDHYESITISRVCCPDVDPWIAMAGMLGNYCTGKAILDLR